MSKKEGTSSVTDELFDLVLTSFSSSSWTECNDRNEPNKLDGRETFCRVRGLESGIGDEDLSKLLFESFRSSAELANGLVGVGGIEKVEL